MRIPPCPHRWSVTPKEAVAIQKRLAGRVRIAPPPEPVRHVAGVDLAFSRADERCYAAAVVWDVARRRVVESRTAVRDLTFPYVPGLLSFREVPAVLDAMRALKTTPDAVLCDGQGLAHPRRFGLASHLGVLLELPTVGCAKSRLCGEYREPGPARGRRTALRFEGERVGTVLRTREGVRPLFVSVGHRFDLESAERLVLACGAGFRLPEPTREADHLAGRAKRGA
jgi:deoxyribonuclease V